MSSVKKISFIHSLIRKDPINYKEFALSNKCKFLNDIKVNDNKLINCINKNIPFYNKHNEDKYNINYDDFINNTKNIYYNIEVGKYKYLSRNLIPYIESPLCFETNNIKSVSQDKKNVDKYLYVSDTSMINRYVEYKNIPNFNNILNDCELIKSHFDNSAWFNFDKNVNSGLHADYNDNILYIICGKKKVLLTSPLYKNCLYKINTKLNIESCS